MKKIGNFLVNVFQRVAFSILSIYSKLRFKIKFNKNGIDLPKNTPILFLSNHQSNWDGIWLRIMYPGTHIFFIVHDELYKNKFMAFLSGKMIDTVKRGNSKNDVGAVKQLLQLKKEGKNIGIFPEGGIAYWHHNLDFDRSLAKLCKKMEIPIAIHNLHGATFIYARYCVHKGHARPVYECKKLITPEEIRAMTVDELHEVLKNNLTVNEYEWQREKMVKVNRKKPAENMHEGLFVCPKCKSIHSMQSHKDTLFCLKCDFTTKVNKYDFFDNEYFDNPVDWDKFQKEYLYTYIKELQSNEIIRCEKIDAKRAETKENYADAINFSSNLTINKNGIFIEYEDGTEDEIKLDNIDKAYVEFKNTLEIKCTYFKYRFIKKSNDWSAYLYANIINTIIQQSKDN